MAGGERGAAAAGQGMAEGGGLAATLLETVAVPALVVDRAGRIERANGAWEGPFGWDPAALHGRPLAEVLEGRGAEPGPCRVIDATGRPRPATLRRRPAPGGRSVVTLAPEGERAGLEAQLVAAFEALDDGFALYDAEDRLVLCNARYREVYAASAAAMVPGVRFEDILRHGLAQGQYAEAAGREEAWLAERLAAHRGSGVRLEQRLGDGRWLRVVEKPTPEGGRVGFRVDITELKRQQAALEAANAQLTAALAARDAAESRFFDIAAVSSDWFWEQDAEGRFTYLSESFGESTGSDPAEVLGRRRREVHRPEECEARPPDWAWLEARIAAREPFRDFVYRLPGGGGTGRWVRVSGAPVFGPDGAFRGYRGVGSDVTELTRALRQAEEASRAKSLFLANMSHEIRTPMNGVIAMADLMAEALTDPAHRQMIAAIRDSGEMLLSIIDDILDFSKIEAGKLDLETVSFQPAEIARRVENLHTLKAAEKNISFAVLTGRGHDAPRLGDPHRILQILHNLVSNAIKFTEAGEVTVAIRCAPEKPLVLEVRDTGIGMSEAQRQAVFEDFVQADSSTTRRFGGTGLGMAIVKRLVRAMGGGIELESRLGAGTRVRVTLPLALAEAAPAREAPPPEAAPRPLPAGLRVLAADDNRTNRVVLEALLKRLGVVADIVASGPEAVEAGRAGGYDLLLLDISMPGMDGTETLAALRAEEAAAGRAPTPAIAVTANAMTHQVAEFLAAGFDAHVAKPIRAPRLVAAMGGCLDRRALGLAAGV